MLKQLPTCGRVVWFYANQSGPTAAIVHLGFAEKGGNFSADLNVLGPTPFFKPRVPQCDAADPRLGHWAWMPYQEAKAARPEGNQSESAERAS